MPQFGTYTDTRDGTQYRVTRMPDGRMWGVTPLSYVTADSKLVNNNAANTALHGLLYRKADAVVNAPAGCVIPSRSTILAMLNSLGLGVVINGGSIPQAICVALLHADDGGSDLFGFGLRRSGRSYSGVPREFGELGWFFACDDFDTITYTAMIGLNPRFSGGLTGFDEDLNWTTTRFIVTDESVIVFDTVAPVFSTFTDSRDGHVYKTVLMPDGKWWAAENLAWAGAGRDYNDNPANRAIYGRLYSSYESVEAVPQGTKVPTREDFNALIAVSGGSKAGIALKSTDLWRYGAGTNVLGFDGRPGGFGVESGFYSMRSSGYFWAAPDPSDLVNSPYVLLEDYSDIFKEYDSIKTNLFSIRFIVDSGYIPDNPFQILTPCTLQMLCDSKVANSSSGRRRTVSRDSSFVFSATLNLPSECEQFEAVPYYNFPVIGDCEIRQLDLVKYTFRDTENTSSVKCMIVPTAMNKRTGDFRISCEPNISMDEAMLVATGSSSLEVLSSSRALSLKCVWTVSFLAATQFIEWLRGSVNRIFTTSVAGMKGVACQIGDSVSLEIGSTDVKISADLAIVNTKQFPLNVTASRVGNVVTVSTGTAYIGTLVNRSGEIVEVVATATNVLTFTTYPENCYLLIREGGMGGADSNVTEWLEL